jgi:thiol-disulfide isomerase/thioredoxin
MSTRLALVGGLFAGLLVGLVVVAVSIAAILALAPPGGPGGPATPSPPPFPTDAVTLSPSLAASPTPAVPSGSDASPSPDPSLDPSAAAGLFGVGRPAPALVVPQVGGGTIDLAALRGKPVWVNFMGTYCPPCRDEFPLMNGFAVRYAQNGLVVIAVDVREDEGLVAAFANELNVKFPLGLDADGSAQATWRAAVLPVHFWIDADGSVRDGAFGGIGPDVMAAGLTTILPGVTVTTR